MSVRPASAGMSLAPAIDVASGPSAPRVSGDEPRARAREQRKGVCAPRQRG